MVKSLIKWPGGKSREIAQIEDLIPSYDRYIEPFFGGGAVFFNQKPNHSYINDISTNLVSFYKLVKDNDISFKNYLNLYSNTWNYMLNFSDVNMNLLVEQYILFRNNNIYFASLKTFIEQFVINSKLELNNNLSKDIILDFDDLYNELNKNLLDKFKRTKENEIKNETLLSDIDLKNNLKTGIMNSLYMYFRNLYNDISLSRNGKENLPIQAKIANFYFIREYCYGSMFRYNRSREFNIPYGGISYNNKDFNRKINNLFNPEITNLFENTHIYNLDFEEFLRNIDLTANDFIFLDPPYDTEFSDYEGRSFDSTDQERLANCLINTEAKFILVIKNTDFIFNLYNNTNLNILTFEKQYSYNVRERNNRNVKHLIITNIEEICYNSLANIEVTQIHTE